MLSTVRSSCVFSLGPIWITLALYFYIDFFLSFFRLCPFFLINNRGGGGQISLFITVISNDLHSFVSPFHSVKSTKHRSYFDSLDEKQDKVSTSTDFRARRTGGEMKPFIKGSCHYTRYDDIVCGRVRLGRRQSFREHRAKPVFERFPDVNNSCYPGW